MTLGPAGPREEDQWLTSSINIPSFRKEEVGEDGTTESRGEVNARLPVHLGAVLLHLRRTLLSRRKKAASTVLCANREKQALRVQSVS